MSKLDSAPDNPPVVQFRPREERQAQFNKACKKFQRHYDLPHDVMTQLCAKLTSVPPEITLREKRLLLGLPPLPSDARWPEFKDVLIPGLKEIGLWKRFSPRGREVLRKRLARHGSTIPHAEGRPAYPYAELEKSFAGAIIEALAQSPRRQRLRARRGGTAGQRRYYSRKFPSSYCRRPCGPALDLLAAALDLALPATGAGDNESRIKRLSQAHPPHRT
jgi:hypothetical protein